MQVRNRQLLVIAALGVALTVALVIYGLPEASDSQMLALALSSLPLSVSVAAGDLVLLQRAGHAPSNLARRTMIGGGVLSAIGLIVMLAALLARATDVVQFGQFLVFVGLLTVLLIAIALQGPAKTEWFTLGEVATTEDDTDSGAETGDDAEADAVEPGASL